MDMIICVLFRTMILIILKKSLHLLDVREAIAPFVILVQLLLLKQIYEPMLLVVFLLNFMVTMPVLVLIMFGQVIVQLSLNPKHLLFLHMCRHELVILTRLQLDEIVLVKILDHILQILLVLSKCLGLMMVLIYLLLFLFLLSNKVLHLQKPIMSL